MYHGACIIAPKPNAKGILGAQHSIATHNIFGAMFEVGAWILVFARMLAREFLTIFLHEMQIFWRAVI